jgi:hypothetical protein
LFGAVNLLDILQKNGLERLKTGLITALNGGTANRAVLSKIFYRFFRIN